LQLILSSSFRLHPVCSLTPEKWHASGNLASFWQILKAGSNFDGNQNGEKIKGLIIHEFDRFYIGV